MIRTDLRLYRFRALPPNRVSLSPKSKCKPLIYHPPTQSQVQGDIIWAGTDAIQIYRRRYPDGTTQCESFSSIRTVSINWAITPPGGVISFGQALRDIQIYKRRYPDSATQRESLIYAQSQPTERSPRPAGGSRLAGAEDIQIHKRRYPPDKGSPPSDPTQRESLIHAQSQPTGRSPRPAGGSYLAGAEAH